MNTQVEQAKAVRYSIATIRSLLRSAFTADDLRRFCQDHSNFRPILSRFSSKSSQEDMIEVVIEYCQVQALFPELLQELAEINPRQYEEHREQLYEDVVPSKISTTHGSPSPIKSVGTSSASKSIPYVISAAFAVLVVLLELLSWVRAGDMVRQALLALVFFILAVVGVWIYQYHELLKNRAVSLVLLFFLPIIVGTALIFAYYVYSYNTVDTAFIAPDFRRFGRILPSPSIYGTNAQVAENVVYESREPTGPKHLLRLGFLMFCDESSTDCDAGWILTNLRGYNASQHHALMFEVRGRRGNEQFGVGLKDSNSTEVKIFDVSSYVAPTGRVITEWQTISIPLTEFRSRNIDLSTLDNLSLFVNAQHTGSRLIEFDVANIRLDN